MTSATWHRCLWHKAWRESRGRFGLTALGLSAICVGGVLFQVALRAGMPLPALRAVAGAPADPPEGAYSAYVYHLIYGGPGKSFFTLMMLFLGLGGWPRERAQGTVSFTLALPVSRARLLWTQAAVGAAEVAGLALIPAVLVPGVSWLAHQVYPLAQALHFSALWFAVGLLLYALTFLLSAVLPGEFTAPVAAYLLLFAQSLVASRRVLAPYRLNVLWTISDYHRMRWNADRTLFESGPLPAVHVAALLVLSLALVGAAVRVIERRDF